MVRHQKTPNLTIPSFSSFWPLLSSSSCAVNTHETERGMNCQGINRTQETCATQQEKCASQNTALFQARISGHRVVRVGVLRFFFLLPPSFATTWGILGEGRTVKLGWHVEGATFMALHSFWTLDFVRLLLKDSIAKHARGTTVMLFLVRQSISNRQDRTKGFDIDRFWI